MGDRLLKKPSQKIAVTTLSQDLVSKILIAELITPDNGGHPQGHSTQRKGPAARS
jgi:hypothetical protein